MFSPEIFSANPALLSTACCAALVSAGAWLQIASYFGWPVSTTHSIVGAIVVFGVVVGGMEADLVGIKSDLLSAVGSSPLFWRGF